MKINDKWFDYGNFIVAMLFVCAFFILYHIFGEFHDTPERRAAEAILIEESIKEYIIDRQPKTINKTSTNDLVKYSIPMVYR